MQKEIMSNLASVMTKLDQMTLMDRFLFNETVEDLEVYNLMVEILMNDEISMQERPETEKELRVSPELRQVRLDVIGMDTAGQLYQMEMQKRNTFNLRKRSRYYQSQIDISLLEPGCADFNKLNDLTTILVAPFDIFGYGLYRYTFEEYCQEVPGLRLNDGARRIFINTRGKNPEVFSEEFLDFMKYINKTTDEVAGEAKSAKIQRIHARVNAIKKSEKVGVKLMQAWEEKYYDKLEAREEGLAEGREEGREEGRTEGEQQLLIRQVCRKLRKGMNLQEICEDLEETEEVLEPIFDAAVKFAPEYEETHIWEELKNCQNLQL